MNLFTRNIPYYHLIKYLLFLLKHSVYIHTYIHIYTHTYVHTYTDIDNPSITTALTSLRNRALSYPWKPLRYTAKVLEYKVDSHVIVLY